MLQGHEVLPWGCKQEGRRPEGRNLAGNDSSLLPSRFAWLPSFLLAGNHHLSGLGEGLSLAPQGLRRAAFLPPKSPHEAVAWSNWALVLSVVDASASQLQLATIESCGPWRAATCQAGAQPF